MKEIRRLVILCDGTWGGRMNGPTSNVQRLATSIMKTVDNTTTHWGPGRISDAIFGPGFDASRQTTLYLAGVGSGYFTDRVVGGALGRGVLENVLTAYRFLALNYHPGDELFLFGFSRGAFTVRLLAGLLSVPGLVRKTMLARSISYILHANRAWSHEASLVGVMRAGPETISAAIKSSEMIQEYEIADAEVPIKFLGVFDTVGAAGRSLMHPGTKLHGMNLPNSVQVARQALAIDEHRLLFAPILWSGSDSSNDIKQVWFEGVHTDVGGGWRRGHGLTELETGLADTCLLWMAREALRSGLPIDEAALWYWINNSSKAVRHNSMRLPYRVMNIPLRLRERVVPSGVFDGKWRRINSRDSQGVRIASSVFERMSQDSNYRPPNILHYLRTRDVEECTEDVLLLDENRKVMDLIAYLRS